MSTIVPPPKAMILSYSYLSISSFIASIISSEGSPIPNFSWKTTGISMPWGLT